MQRGPLSDVRVVEFSALGPVPFCAMLLADMGADVVQIARPHTSIDTDNFMQRGRRVIPLDLKQPHDRDTALDLIARADVLLEGNRPGVMESLGLGPDTCTARNPRLVYGRMTGWGQTGPLASTAGHDINYIALTGVLDAIGVAGSSPVPPLNLIGDYGGGAMFLAFGTLCALWEARASGLGQVIDAAMVDGSAMLMSLFCRLLAQGKWNGPRGTRILDGGAPWYTTYRTADNRYVAVGALEEPFWQALLAGLEISPASLPPRSEKGGWPVIRAALADRFATRTRDAWAKQFRESDACVSPVLNLQEAAENEHIAARHTYVADRNFVRPATAPRLNRTPASEAVPPTLGTAQAVLEAWQTGASRR
ncbi:CoA transferase [Paraburkholderia sp. Ac-20342]|uniref:CaiB/BaiF CoA transferase family protein n=1 Tax=Paraburkholderia sp. Ac-20342 TaxID=2703889 RepID=UPI00197E1687|nr:CaiB/BaiF CoA-transferase family protein [Paraburkholderia sp. Ac-20342]MBN3846283.1 CoA transferase [Paraburkholderia sp. Ac-20342]